MFVYQYLSLRNFQNGRCFICSVVWLLRLLDTDKLILEAIRSDDSGVAEELRSNF